jgi:hypothetical protein
MQTRDEALADGEELKRLILLKAMTHDDLIRKLGASEERQKKVEQIDGTLNFVSKKIKPHFEDRNIPLYEKGRASRSFENELQRLWGRALICYQLHCRKALGPEIEAYLVNSENQITHQEFLDMVADELRTQVVPLLEKHETPGDDFYLLIDQLQKGVADKDAAENIANSRATLHETAFSIFGMVGLLIQAKRYQQRGLMNQAYSCLLDASDLIGMYNGARYAMNHLPTVAAKIRAKVNSEKSRAKTDKLKLRAIDLFYALRPTDKDGKPQIWKSANKASEAVWDKLVKEADKEGELPAVSDRTVLSWCQKLHKRDKEGGNSLDFRVEAIQLLNDDEPEA